MLPALAALATLSATSPARATGVLDCWLHKSDCADLAGKRYWVRPMGAESEIEVTFVKGDWGKTLKLRSGPIVITGVSPNKTFGYDLAVKLPDGRTGWIWNSSAHLLSPTDPIQDAKEAAVLAMFNRKDCERRGPPKIGMTAEELVETCWRTPQRIVKKTTAAGVEELYLYIAGRRVTLVDGKVTEIVEAR